MITLENDSLVFRFPEVHEHAECAIDLHRTLRIPDDGNTHYLPPGLGCFPLRHLDDYAHRLPDSYSSRGGVIMPMYQAEALWIGFGSNFGYPFAVKIATGKICAVTGDSWVNHLNQNPQDYVVLPDQPWLDGYCVEKGLIRQFVATPLGDGHTIEEQLTGGAEVGGIQIIAYPMKAARYEALRRSDDSNVGYPRVLQCAAVQDMGLAAGGKMRQEIYQDEYGLDVWDLRHASRCFVTIANSIQWSAITGELPTSQPVTTDDYAYAGLPWFDYYSEQPAVEPSSELKGIKSLGQIKAEQGVTDPEDQPIGPISVIELGSKRRSVVREFL